MIVVALVVAIALLAAIVLSSGNKDPEVEVMNPTDSVATTEAVEASESTESTETSEPSASAEASESTETTAPSETDETTKPEETAEATNATESTVPEETPGFAEGVENSPFDGVEETTRQLAERTRIFGQYDHRRIYGRDYAKRLEDAGFEVYECDYANLIPAKEKELYALTDELLYIVRKP